MLKVKPEKVKPELPFDLADCPFWANWVAQDESGTWYAYEKKPYVDQIQWSEESKDGEVRDIWESEVKGDWRETLYEVPKREK